MARVVFDRLTVCVCAPLLREKAGVPDPDSFFLRVLPVVDLDFVFRIGNGHGTRVGFGKKN